jgi:hypothetical protein
MNGVFQFIISGELKTFIDYRDIPENFDHLIKFLPKVPDGPHTDQQHNEIDEWNQRLQKLMEKERARSDKSPR